MISRFHHAALGKERGSWLSWSFSLHGAVTAQRDAPQGVQRFPLLLFPNGRAHADGEFVDFDSEQFGRYKVAEFVNGNEKSEHQDCKDNIKNVQAFSLLN